MKGNLIKFESKPEPFESVLSLPTARFVLSARRNEYTGTTFSEYAARKL